MNIAVIVTLAVEGFHNWAECPLEEVAFLRDKHRHVFNVRAEKVVTHADRQVEIILLKRQMTEWLSATYGTPCQFGGRSCEQIAEHLLVAFALSSCEVLEDNENGAKVTAPTVRDEAMLAETYVDATELLRSRWYGSEVEGRFTGLPTLFLTQLEDRLPDRPHVFLCPTVIQRASAAEVEQYLAMVKREGRVATLAVRPTDLSRLTPAMILLAHIMVDIPLPDGLTLKPTDTIKIELAPYTTKSVTLGQMQATFPCDYANDTF